MIVMMMMVLMVVVMEVPYNAVSFKELLRRDVQAP
jgi:hypothetical protein